MLIASLSWPVAMVIAVAIAAVATLLAIGLWQTFAIVVRDDRETAREQRLRQAR